MSHDPTGKPCPNPKCDSSDGYKIKPDTGWGHCFVCGYNVPPDGRKEKMQEEKVDASPFSSPPEHYQPLPERSISEDSCRRYRVWKDNKGYYYFPNFLEGRQVGLKLRSPDKDFKWKGKQKDLFGQHLFPAGSAKFITVVEGEFDALAAFELLGSRYPVVSVLNGTGTAEQDVKRNWEYLNSFDNIVFAFDNDEPGLEAAKKCGAMFEDGKVKILKLKNHKDANDYLKAKDANGYTKEWWNAPTLVKEGLKIGNEMWDEIENRPNHFSTAYPFAGLQNFTYGIRLSEFVTVTADTGVGKTSLLKHIEHKLLTDPELIEKKYGVGFMHLEEPNYDTALGLMSIHNNKPYHLPDVPRTKEELRSAFDAVINNDRVVIWDHFGSNRIESVLAKVRHMAALGCKYIVIDHLSIIVSDQSGDERKQLDEISTKLKTLCMELNIALICVIHQNRQGQIRGTAGVEQLSNIVMKAYRDHTNPDEWRRNVTKVVIEKNRFSGKCGPACWLFYNEMTSRLIELTEDEVKKYEEGGTIRDDEMPF